MFADFLSDVALFSCVLLLWLLFLCVPFCICSVLCVVCLFFSSCLWGGGRFPVYCFVCVNVDCVVLFVLLCLFCVHVFPVYYFKKVCAFLL